MINIAGKLHASVLSVAPIEGVYIGKLDDRKTWGVHFKPDVTAAQIEAAANVIKTFDLAKAEAEAIAEAAQDPIAELKAKVAALEAKAK